MALVLFFGLFVLGWGIMMFGICAPNSYFKNYITGILPNDRDFKNSRIVVMIIGIIFLVLTVIMSQFIH